MMIQVIDKSFGFDTAVEEAQRAINAAHVEVGSVDNGVGIVKLMGRYSGTCVQTFTMTHHFFVILNTNILFPHFCVLCFLMAGFIATIATLASRDVVRLHSFINSIWVKFCFIVPRLFFMQ